MSDECSEWAKKVNDGGLMNGLVKAVASRSERVISPQESKALESKISSLLFGGGESE